MSEAGGDAACPSQHASFHPVAGGGVVFDAAERRLYGLNPAAGLIWLCLSEGMSLAAAAQALGEAFAIDRTEAEAWVKRSVATFGERGLLRQDTAAPAPSPPTDAPQRPRAPVQSEEAGLRCRLLGHEIRVRAPACLDEHLAGLLAGWRVRSMELPQPAATIDLDIQARGQDWTILLDGRDVAECATESVAPEVERHLVQAVVPATPHLLALHAAAAQRHGTTILLAGPSGAGKTSLSVAMAAAGWRYGTDELVLLRHDLHLLALPLPACIKHEMVPATLTRFPDLGRQPEHLRYGRRVRYLPVRAQPLAPARVRVVFPRYAPGGGATLTAVDSFAGLERLLAQCIFVPPGFLPGDVGLLLRWHGEIEYFDLLFGSTGTALELLRSLTDSPLCETKWSQGSHDGRGHT